MPNLPLLTFLKQWKLQLCTIISWPWLEKWIQKFIFHLLNKFYAETEKSKYVLWIKVHSHMAKCAYKRAGTIGLDCCAKETNTVKATSVVVCDGFYLEWLVFSAL